MDRMKRTAVIGPGLLFALLMCGCGTAIQRQGTEQLLLSDSVDHAIDQLDLSGLAGRKIYLDTEYMRTFKGNNISISSDYIISALRQKLTTTGCRIQQNRADADYVLEARIGALGTDTMEVIYGIPASNVGAAANALTGAPMLPSIPEVSVGKRNGAMGVSKIAVYAYHRETGIPVWQSGAAVARSDAKDSWFLGVGPLTRGSVYNEVTLAGNRVNPPFEKKSRQVRSVKPVTIADRHSYVHPAALERQLAEASQPSGDGDTDGGVQPVAHSTSDSAAPAVGADASDSGHAVVPSPANQSGSREPPKVPPSQ